MNRTNKRYVPWSWRDAVLGMIGTILAGVLLWLFMR
jgi:hypothetical protein